MNREKLENHLRIKLSSVDTRERVLKKVCHLYKLSDDTKMVTRTDLCHIMELFYQELANADIGYHDGSEVEIEEEAEYLTECMKNEDGEELSMEEALKIVNNVFYEGKDFKFFDIL